MPLHGAMKLPKDDDGFDDDERENLFTESNLNREPPNPIINCCVTGVATVQFWWIFRRMECLLGVVLLVSVTLALTGVIETYEMKKHTFKNHQFRHDYFGVQSSLELKLKDIDHWCLDGGDTNCPTCDDPTQAISRGEYDGWKEAFMRNVRLSKDVANKGVQPDVIFVGDSLVEASVGTLKGIAGLDESRAAKELDKIKGYYDTHFSKSNGAKYEGLRLGIAGDTAPNVFWRLRQKESRNLIPKVWWISVGRNDLFRTKCSEEVALVGVIRVIEELLSKNDGATIVINSLLPTANKSTLQLEGRHANNDMWKSIQEVNVRLKKFAQKHHHVVFYDANEVFVESKFNKKFIFKRLYADKLHPSFAGYKALVTDQLEFLDTLMKKRTDAQANKDTSTTTSTTPVAQHKDEGDSTANENTDTDENEEYLNYDDYYGYASLFNDEDDILNDITFWSDDW